MTHTTFDLGLSVDDGYTQTATFDDASLAPLVVDEPAPLGENAGPNPARLLGAAVGGCLGASLLFCLRKSRIDVDGLNTRVHGTLARNADGRMRVASIDVLLEPRVPADQHERAVRCLTVFEDYCIVTASIRPAVAVNVRVNLVAPAMHAASAA